METDSHPGVRPTRHSFLQLHSGEGLRAYVRGHLHVQRQQQAVIPVSSLLANMSCLPAAAFLFSLLTERIRDINSRGKFAYVYGFEPLLALWNAHNQQACLKGLRSLLDNSELHVALLVCLGRDELRRDVFKNPRYEPKLHQEDADAGGDASSPGHESMALYAEDLRPLAQQITRHCHTLEKFCQHLESSEPCEDILVVCLPAQGFPQANAHQAVVQVSTFKQHLDYTYEGKIPPLSDAALQWLHQRLGNTSQPLEHLLQYEFGDDRKYLPVNVLETYAQAPDEARENYFWFLKQHVDAREAPYLHRVLHDQETTWKNFVDSYVCYPHKLIKQGRLRPDELQRCAQERRQALQRLPERLAAMRRHIKYLRTFEKLSQVLPWLMNNTEDERIELVRRVMELSYSREEYHELGKVYPVLADYLADYQFGQQREVAAYFSEYRRLKLVNRLDQDFLARASQVSYPYGFPMRRELLAQRRADTGCFLLVVDALGAEYLPLLCSWAKHEHLVCQARVAFSQLPTSTEFNALDWPATERSLAIKTFDHAVHQGADSHKDDKPEVHLEAALQIIERDVLPAISRHLADYPRVLVTSDHGASRLAVLAYNQGLSQTLVLPLPAEEKPDDWRYCRLVPGCATPPGVVAENGYWVVKGYNRLGKSGGKDWELHGGLSWEETLVPFVLFENDSASLMAEPVETAATGFEEADGFDDL